MSERKAHWENVYLNKSPDEVSWYQQEPTRSLQLIRTIQLDRTAAIIDVGGGASTLVDKLCDDGYKNIGVLDVSAHALAHSKERLADKACRAEWYEEDITEFEPPHQYALWHDRAVFHFLTRKSDRKKYVNILKRALLPGGHLIIMAFAIDGPKKCSGLDIVQYDADKLMAELAGGFELVETGNEVHMTPAGKEQKFAYFHFTRNPGIHSGR